MFERCYVSDKRPACFALLAALVVIVCGSGEAVTISGRVRDVNGVGITGITVRASNGGGSTTTTTGGVYSLAVTAPYTGMVGPEGMYQFSPVHYEYTGLTTDLANQDFLASPLIFGNGHLATVLSYYSTSRGAAVWGDYNNTGTLDVALAGYGVTTSPSVLGPVARVFRGDGASNFVDAKVSLTGVRDAAAAWADYDNDGRLDLVIAGDTGSAYVTKLYRYNGSSFLPVNTAGLPGVTKGHLAWADYDNDGRLDLLVAGISASGRIAKLYHNDGGGVFTENAAVSLPGLSECAAAWADYDNDGRQDFAIAGNTGEGCVTRIYHNDGAGQFSDICAQLTGVGFASVAWGDYDNDGLFDLAFAGVNQNGDKITRVCRNTGSGFVEQDLGLPGVRGGIAWGDYDNDGRLDLALAGDQDASDCPKAFRNNGDGTFTGYIIESIDITDAWVAWGDYGADGKLDVIVAGDQASGYPCTYLYQNQAATANTAPSAPSGLSASWSNGALTMSWNASTDAQTPQAGLCYNIRVGTAPGEGDVFTGMADYSTGYRRVPAIGNVGKNLSWTLTGLIPRDYYWSVQAIDTSLAGSAWATEAFVADPEPPTISISAPSTTLTNVGPVTYTITYFCAYSVTLSESDITLNKTGTADGTVSVDGSGLTTRTVTISNITGNGTLGISIAPGTASNNSGSCPGAGPSATFAVDNVAPTVSIGSPSASITKGGPVSYEITYDGADAVTLAADNVTLNKTGTADGTVAVSGTGLTTRTVTISNITGDGTIGISITAATARDNAGNTAPAAGPSETFIVDNTPPTAAALSVTPGFTRADDVQATFGGSSDANGVTYKLKLDDGEYGVETSPKTISVAGLSEGAHTVYVKAVDPVGNESAESTAQFVYDKTAPVIGSIWFLPTLISAGDPVIVCAEVTDAVGVVSVTANGDPLARSQGDLWLASFAAAAGLGTHDVEVKAFDEAGNSATSTASYNVVRCMGLNNRALTDAVLRLASYSYVFTVWGRVHEIDEDSFWLDDGSNRWVQVFATAHGLREGDYASARGALDVTDNPPVLIAYVVTKQN